MNPNDLQNRTKEFALRVMKLSSFLEKDSSLGRLIGRQIFRSGTSVAANYRAGMQVKISKRLYFKIRNSSRRSGWNQFLAGTIKRFRNNPRR